MSEWRRHLKEPRVWVMIAFGLSAVVIMLWFSKALVPIFAALVVGYLLDPLVDALVKWRFPRWLAVVLVMIGTVMLLVLILMAVVPAVVEQLNQLANQVPGLITQVDIWLGKLQGNLPEFIKAADFQSFLDRLSVGIQDLLGGLITGLLSWAGSTIGGVVNAVIAAFLIFFLLKDKEQIWAFILRVFPYLKNEAVHVVLADIDRQMGKFIKGKFIVVFLLFLLSTFVFWIIGLDFFLLLGIMTGLSTFIPYIGATVVAVPVVASGYLQWGTLGKTIMTFAFYLGVQIVDGNYMTPVIIGRETHIHPIGIIAAILICGAIWGFWGVVFSVPVAVVIKSVLDVLYFPSMEKAALEELEVDTSELPGA